MIDFAESSELESTSGSEVVEQLPEIAVGLWVQHRTIDSESVLKVHAIEGKGNNLIRLWAPRLIGSWDFALAKEGNIWDSTRNDFWSSFKPVELRRPLEPRRTSADVGYIVRQIGSSVERIITGEKQDQIIIDGNRFFTVQEFWRDFEIIEEAQTSSGLDQVDLQELLRLGAELRAVNGLIEELAPSYTGKGMVAAYTSEVFRTLNRRRQELRSQLVALG